MSEKLMRQVKEKAGPYIKSVLTIDHAFLAALVANESAGDKDASRKEPHVLMKLSEVASGEREAYNGVTATMFWSFPLGSKSVMETSPADYALQVVRRLQNASTSWGFTQIMGYHMLRWNMEILDLLDPLMHFSFTARLMKEFVDRFKLDPGKDFEQMARCWNTGAPEGRKTHDPEYLPNILRRMELWNKIQSNEV